MGGKGSGGYRQNSGRKKLPPYKKITYRVPVEFEAECVKEIKEVLEKYRKQCTTRS